MARSRDADIPTLTKPVEGNLDGFVLVACSCIHVWWLRRHAGNGADADVWRAARAVSVRSGFEHDAVVGRLA